MTIQPTTRLLDGRAILGERCDTDTCELWHDHEVWLYRIRDRCGVEYVSDAIVMLRLDIVELVDVDEWGTWLTGPDPVERRMDWIGLRPVVRPSDSIFTRALVEPLIEQGCTILPLEHALRLDHHSTLTPPHAVMWGENLVGYICPANTDKVREAGTQENYVRAVTV